MMQVHATMQSSITAFFKEEKMENWTRTLIIQDPNAYESQRTAGTSPCNSTVQLSASVAQ